MLNISVTQHTLCNVSIPILSASKKSLEKYTAENLAGHTVIMGSHSGVESATLNKRIDHTHSADDPSHPHRPYPCLSLMNGFHSSGHLGSPESIVVVEEEQIMRLEKRRMRNQRSKKVRKNKTKKLSDEQMKL